MPLISVEQKRLGSMIMIEDISSEKRMKSTMSRYMDPAIADQLLAAGAEVLGGQSVDGDRAVLGHPQLHDASPRSSGRRARWRC